MCSNAGAKQADHFLDWIKSRQMLLVVRSKTKVKKLTSKLGIIKFYHYIFNFRAATKKCFHYKSVRQ